MNMRSPMNLALFSGLGFIMGLAAALMFCQPRSGLSVTNRAKMVMDVTQTLDRQSAAWNRGDIGAFMKDYWKSPDLRFASNNSINTGWQATKDGYGNRYPTDEAMGRLEFTDKTVDILSPTDALVFGRFTLYRVEDEPTGLFTLHLKNIDKTWQIVSDHTSTE